MSQTDSKQIDKRDLGYDFIRFIATVMIVIHHFVTTLHSNNLHVPRALQLLVSHGGMGFGGCGVALFFLLSGSLLYKHYIDKFNMKFFYCKRALRILIPQQIGFVAAFIATYVVYADIANSDKMGLVISFFGLDYCGIPWIWWGIQTIWLIGEWFTTVIILIYLLFPFLRWLFLKFNKITTIIIISVFVLNIKFQVLTGGDGWFSITNGIMYFWCGMLFEKNKHYLNSCMIITAIVLVILMYVLNPKSILGYAYPVCFIFSLLLFIALYQMQVTGRFIRYICKYSYEIYLVHHRIFIILVPRLISTDTNDLQLFYCSLFLIGITFLSAEALTRATNFILNFVSSLQFYIKNKVRNNVTL